MTKNKNFDKFWLIKKLEFGDFILTLPTKIENKKADKQHTIASYRPRFTEKFIALLTDFPIKKNEEIYKFFPTTDDSKAKCIIYRFLQIPKEIRNAYETSEEQLDAFLAPYFEKNKIREDYSVFTNFLKKNSSYYLIKEQLYVYTGDSKYLNLLDSSISNICKKIDVAIHHGDGEHINRNIFSVTLLKKKTHDEFHAKFGKNSYQKSKSIVKKLNEKREKSKKKQLDKNNTKRFDKLTNYITFVESYSNIEDPKTKLITMYNNYASTFNCKNCLDVFIEAIKTEYPEF